MNLPNILTLFRILLIPFYILFCYQNSLQNSIIAAVIFSIAVLTDFFDGYLARARSEVTKFGKFLDPIADKLLIVSALILLVDSQRIPAWLVIVIIGREFAVTGFRAIASSEGIVISAEKIGKYKMFLQSVAVIILTIDFPNTVFHKTGLFLLMISMVLAIFSAWQYFSKYGRSLNLLNVK